MVTLTTDWGSIQSRAVDPYAQVDSDVANAQNICFGDSKIYFRGFGLGSFEIDSGNNLLVGNFYAGSVIMDNVSIKFNNSFTLALVSFPNLISETKHIVVKYEYVKTNPAPEASILVVSDEDFDADTQLKLYTFVTNSWANIIDLSTWNSWIEQDENWVDRRFNTGVVFRDGDTISDNISCLVDPTTDNHLTRKSYVDTLIDNTLNVANILKTTGGVITGAVTWDVDRVPLTSKELITKGYVDTTFLPLAGGTVVGPTIFSASVSVPTPTNASHAVNVEYINAVLGDIDEGVLYLYLRKTGGSMTGAISMATAAITDNSHLINVSYGDSRYLKLAGGILTGPLQTSTDYITNNNCVINKNYADENYLPLVGGILTGAASLLDDSLINSDNDLITRSYGDGRYITIGSPTSFNAFKILTESITDILHVVNKDYVTTNLVSKSDTSYWNNERNTATMTENGTMTLQSTYSTKWGKVSIPSLSSDSWTTVTFATAFPTECLNVVTTLGVTTGSDVYGLNTAVKNFTPTTFDLYTGYFDSGSCVVYYQAVGR